MDDVKNAEVGSTVQLIDEDGNPVMATVVDRADHGGSMVVGLVYSSL